MSSITRGCLLIADVSGYTRYLGGVELDHAQDILADLLGAVVANTSVMRTAKLEGDAVFCHAPAGDIDGAALVDTIESCYFAFTKRLRTIAHLTTCACNACSKLDGLDLKFVVHCGQYATHVVADSEELVGYDVILVHRLLKNRVAAATGTRGYALLTMPAIVELGLEKFADGLTPLRVSVDDGDEIDVRVLDLSARWSELQRTCRMVDEPEVEVCADVEAPPAEVWRVMAPTWRPRRPRSGASWRRRRSARAGSASRPASSSTTRGVCPGWVPSITASTAPTRRRPTRSSTGRRSNTSRSRPPSGHSGGCGSPGRSSRSTSAPRASATDSPSPTGSRPCRRRWPRPGGTVPGPTSRAWHGSSCRAVPASVVSSSTATITP